ncbi:hypothetical protein R1CP_32210 [Rhodococcus opacus]|uniref:Uncharacterized protein n=1 Tax=Rhodococcus opacus TaxID=37919 RepID=A0A1B1KEN9_RHOOP|nr:hypothetical protein R1CP_32210 [Rhodococcus opacus]
MDAHPRASSRPRVSDGPRPHRGADQHRSSDDLRSGGRGCVGGRRARERRVGLANRERPRTTPFVPPQHPWGGERCGRGCRHRSRVRPRARRRHRWVQLPSGPVRIGRLSSAQRLPFLAVPSSSRSIPPTPPRLPAWRSARPGSSRTRLRRSGSATDVAARWSSSIPVGSLSNTERGSDSYPRKRCSAHGAENGDGRQTADQPAFAASSASHSPRCSSPSIR